MNRAVMSPELIGILSVGVALAGLTLTMYLSLDSRLLGLDARLDKVEQNIAVLLERTTPLAPVVAKPFDK